MLEFNLKASSFFDKRNRFLKDYSIDSNAILLSIWKEANHIKMYHIDQFLNQKFQQEILPDRVKLGSVQENVLLSSMSVSQAQDGVTLSKLCLNLCSSSTLNSKGNLWVISQLQYQKYGIQNSLPILWLLMISSWIERGLLKFWCLPQPNFIWTGYLESKYQKNDWL